ncbi:MAG: NUDIX hydrolase [Arenicellales bacterium]
MNYCSNCGEPVVVRVPEGDTLPRYVCDHCDAIHYQNPKIVAGCIPVWEDRILLCKRGIEPQLGRWTLPAGFMENGETVQQAAARETMEEALAQVADLELFGMFNIPHVSQVYVIFRARMPERKFAPGQESLSCDLVTEEQIPWAEIAFPVIDRSLRLFLEDRRNGRFAIHTGDIEPRRR